MTEAQKIRRKLRRNLQTADGRKAMRILLDFLELELESATPRKKAKLPAWKDKADDTPITIQEAKKTIEQLPKQVVPQVPTKNVQQSLGGIISSKSLGVATPVAGSGMSDAQKNKDNRRPEITQLLEQLRKALGVPVLDDTEARNRQYCWIMIRKFGRNKEGSFDYTDGVTKVGLIIEATAQNSFWKYRATSFHKLWLHGVEIINSTKDLKGRIINV